MKINNKTIGMVFIATLMINLVIAGVGFPKEIEVYPGEDHIEYIVMQNLGADKPDMEFEVIIREGGEYVSFRGDGKETVPQGEIEYYPLHIEVPSNAQIGDTYNGKISVRALPMNPEGVETGEGSAIQFTTGAGFEFIIKVVPKPSLPSIETPKPSTTAYVAIILGVVALIIIIWFIIKKKRKK